jgi:hypothetical protein
VIRRLARPALALGALGLAASAAGQARKAPPSPAPPLVEIVRPAPATPAALRERLQAAWSARDAAAYLALWHFASEEERQGETRFAATRFASDELTMQVREARAEPGAFLLPAQVFSVSEPRARVEEMVFRASRQGEGYLLSAREERPSIDGLMHLTLDRQAFRATGMRVRLEDFEIDLHQGSIFTSPPELGPTAVVFVGKATAHFRPRPPAERDQLRQFSGQPELHENVSAFFLRLHPADFHRIFAPGRLEPDPAGAGRLKQAQRMFDENATTTFVLDAALPRSPWWLMPAVGDSALAFRSRLGTLSYTLSGGEAEGVSLFDRSRRRQICLYPRAGREGKGYSEDEGRAVDVLHHDLSVRFDPVRSQLQVEDVMRLRLDAAGPTLRLRLHADLAVQSVVSREAGEHLFFRIRHQDGLLVSLGALAGRIGEVTLTVRYAGVHVPGPVEREVMQGPAFTADGPDDDIPLESSVVYSNRTAWYPQYDSDDYALARLRFDLPAEQMALTGGRQVSNVVQGGRRLVEYAQELPAKYITVAFGRFTEVGRRQVGTVAVQAYGLARTRRDAALLLDDAAAMVPFFEKMFGPFPYPTLRVALVEGFTPGGHSPPGMVVLSQRPAMMRSPLRPDPAGFWDVPGFFFAHELAHQWWGHAVAGENYHERWLSESFAQYGAALWVRERLGQEEFEDVLARMARWALRTTAQGPISLGYRLGHVRGDPQIYRAIVYDKGACVLHMLHGLVGETAFTSALRALQERFRFRKAGTDDVRQALEAASGRDLGPYFEEWIRGTTLPRLVVQQHRDKSDATTVEVTVQGLPGPVPLALTLTGAGGREVHTVQLPPGGGRWTFESTGTARRVQANGDRGLLAWVEEK